MVRESESRNGSDSISFADLIKISSEIFSGNVRSTKLFSKSSSGRVSVEVATSTTTGVVDETN